MRWDSPLRIRHVPSGRYLAIDLSREISAEISSATTGKWFTACLVDDEKYYEDDAAADEIGFKEADATSMIFQASATDVNMGEFVPALDIVNIRICHVTETGSAKEVYFMHNTHIAKPVRDGCQASARSSRLVFSTVNSVQDTLKLMRATPHEIKTITTMKDFIAPLASYSLLLSDPTAQDTNEVPAAASIIALLLRLIEMLILGKFDFQEQDWIKRAHDTRPAQLSDLLTGKPNELVQNSCRDVKLMDVVFGMTFAPFPTLVMPSRLHW